MVAEAEAAAETAEAPSEKEEIEGPALAISADVEEASAENTNVRYRNEMPCY